MPDGTEVDVVGRPLRDYTDAELALLLTCVVVTSGGPSMEAVLRYAILQEVGLRRLKFRQAVDALVNRALADVRAAIREVPS